MDIKKIKGRIHDLLIGFDSFMASLVPQNPLNGSMCNSVIEWPKSDAALDYVLQDRVQKLMSLMTCCPCETEVVRKGSDTDGGYFISSENTSYASIISFGVGSDISFETELMDDTTFAHFYDNSINQLPTPIQNSAFFKETVGKNGVDLSEAVSRISVSPILLKCDIEGAEWNLFGKAESSDISKFEQIVIEFHGLQFLYLDQIFEEQILALEKIFITHTPIFSSSNNFGKFFLIGGRLVPEVVEVTYLKRELHACAKIKNTRDLVRFRNDPNRIAWTTSFDSLR
jgi:hypothetical protein